MRQIARQHNALVVRGGVWFADVSLQSEGISWVNSSKWIWKNELVFEMVSIQVLIKDFMNPLSK